MGTRWSSWSVRLRSLRHSVRGRVDAIVARIARIDTVRLLIVGYLSYVLAGWLALALPWSRQGEGVSLLDHLFISASAVSTTGLTSVSTSGTYSWFGELVVLLLIQFGGLGYMTLSSFMVLAVSGGLTPLRDRVTRVTLALPQGFEPVAFLRLIVRFTLAIEAIGAVLLYPSFVASGAPDPIWQSIFHSVSAFCTAGFGLYDDSLERFRSDLWLNSVVTVLSVSGAIGFIVMHDVSLSLRNRRPHVTLTSKVILWSTFWIIAIGTLLFATEEPTVRNLPLLERWSASLFQVMSASTTVGFNTLPIGPLSSASLYLLILVMLIGASPSGTGGGLKTTTFSALWAEMTSVVRRRNVTTFLGKAIPEVRMRAAVAGMMLYAMTLAIGIYALALVESSPLPDLMFEAASALGTVGLSRGITASLTPTGKCILIALMFVGRVGPVVIGMSFFVSRPETTAEEMQDVAI